MTTKSLRQQIIDLLNENALFSTKRLCELAHIDYRTYAQYVRNIRSWWKYNYQNGEGLKCLSFHRTWFFSYALKAWDRSRALGYGWNSTRARNRMFVFKSKLGRVEWFETGRITVKLRKIWSNKGHRNQLLCDAFSWTKIGDNVDLLEFWLDSFQLLENHIVQKLGEKLPYSRNELLRESLGIVVTTGDRSHRDALEIEFHLPDWVQRYQLLEDRNLVLLDKFVDLLEPKGLVNGRPDKGNPFSA